MHLRIDLILFSIILWWAHAVCASQHAPNCHQSLVGNDTFGEGNDQDLENIASELAYILELQTKPTYYNKRSRWNHIISNRMSHLTGSQTEKVIQRASQLHRVRSEKTNHKNQNSILKPSQGIDDGQLNEVVTSVFHLSPQLIYNRLLHEGIIYSLSFSKNSRLLVTSSTDSLVKVWDFSQDPYPYLQHFYTLNGHTEIVSTAEISPQGHLILSCSTEGKAALWDSFSTHQRWEYLATGSREIVAGHFSPDGDRFVLAIKNQGLEIWDTKALRKISDLISPMGSPTTATFSPSGRLIAASTEAGGISIWEVETGQSKVHFIAHQIKANSIQFSPDEKTILTAGSDGVARLWSLERSKTSRISEDRSSRLDRKAAEAPFRVLQGHFGPIQNAKFSVDGEWIATASRDGFVKLWSAKTAQFVMDLQIKNDKDDFLLASDIEFSPDGKFIAIASMSNLKIFSLYKSVSL